MKLEIDGQAELASGIALAIWPDRSPSLIGNAISGTPAPLAGASATIRLRYAPPGPNEKLSLLNLGALQLDARGVTLQAGFTTNPDGTDLNVRLALPGLRAQLGGLGQDSFLSQVLPENAAFEMDVGLGWSMSRGLSWESGAGPNIRLPVSITIGPVKLEAVEIEFSSPGDTLELGVRLTASAQIGPVYAQVQGVGFALRLDSGGGNFGLFDLGGALKGPRGIALSIDVQGVVTGGGTLIHFESEGMYATRCSSPLHDEFPVRRSASSPRLRMAPRLFAPHLITANFSVPATSFTLLGSAEPA
jgi:hypothetical protein